MTVRFPERKTFSRIAPAKINLMLAVTGPRADGFHGVVSLVAPDLVMTLKQVFSGSMTSKSAAMRSGSTLSST